jgi:rhamnosyltransferase
MKELLSNRMIVVFHCFYLQTLQDFISISNRLPVGHKLIITTDSNPKKNEILSIFNNSENCPEVYVFENKGRDIYPFIKILKQVDISDAKLILKLHGKKSLYSEYGDDWRKSLFDGLMPSYEGVNKIIDEFSRKSKLGMVGASGSFLSNKEYWGANYNCVKKIVYDATGKITRKNDLGFYAGSMFWIRTDVIKRIIEVIDEQYFEEESGQRDGTYAHAIERAIPIISHKLDYLNFETDLKQRMAYWKCRKRKLKI